MDSFNYKSHWNEQDAPLPDMRLNVYASQWDLYEGRHPTLLGIDEAYWQRNPFADWQDPRVGLEQQIRPMGCVHGHNTLADVGFSSLIDVDVNVPISPLFGRDLCGRSIYLGYGPHRKTLAEWEAYRVLDAETSAEGTQTYPRADLAAVTFPKNCRVLPQNSTVAEYLETVFLTKFRTLDMGFEFQATASGDKSGDPLTGIYADPNLYPYKLRLDTFYTDGFKLPQIQAVFALQDVPSHQAQQAGKDVITAWENRPSGQDYEAFHQAQGGEDWAEDLFNQGCTLIPTFEACNGFHKVGREFELEEYWPGRAVMGLHEITDIQDNEAPAGTILEVLQPGYVTYGVVVPAKVIISNGSQYVSPNAEDPMPMLPDLRLPHQRTSTQWGATWLPTHPEHFEAPAIWGWDPLTGFFMQLIGPIWDPLHYYYECTDIILNAFKTPRPDNRWLVDVPAEMAVRFYPIVPQPGFDTLSAAARDERQQKQLLPRSAVVRKPTPEPTAAAAYHPLPPQFEYELDPFWFPELMPATRLEELCPEELRPLRCPLIRSSVTPQQYLESLDVPEGADWLQDPENVTAASEDPLQDYPFLQRYLNPDLEGEDLTKLVPMQFLENPSDLFLSGKASEVWRGLDPVEAYEKHADPALFEAIWGMRENALKLLKVRHDLYRRNPDLYNISWWLGLTVPMMEIFFKEFELSRDMDSARAEVKETEKVVQAQQQTLGPTSLPGGPIGSFVTPLEHGQVQHNPHLEEMKEKLKQKSEQKD